MLPILFHIFEIAIPAWHTLVMLAAIFAFFYAQFALRKIGDERCLNALPFLFTLAYVSGWFGSRALGIFLEEPERLSFSEFILALIQMGPMVFYGGVISGTVSVVIAILWKKLPIGILFDVAIPTVVLGLGVGRIGCFLNGCDYGIPLSNNNPKWWSHINPVLGDNVYRYPTQLQECLASLTLAYIGAYCFARKIEFVKQYPTRLGSILLLASALNRFGNEIFRGDFRGSFLDTSFSTSQGISLILGGTGLFLLVRSLVLGKQNNVPLV